ncbi:hypothetical protein ABZW32_13045 [Streptomyces sp. NPDC004667]|uniref:hypothetical protein n=1 Tax=Streptomyces sp. NPDC004667 TaxID=3154285 RepID=UPI0033A10732
MAEEYYDPNDRPPAGAPADSSPIPLAGGPLKPPPPPPNGQPWSGPPTRPAGNPYQQDQVPVMDGNSAPAPIPTAPAGADATDHVRIGLWGAPRSGKTSFLGALPIAAMQAQRYGQGSWRISGMSREANNFLNDSVTRLSTRRIFPEASVGLRGMSWSVQGEEPSSGVLRKRSRRTSFVLDINDAAGEVFQGNNPLHEQITDQLSRAQGLIYLFDPLGDAEEATESFSFFFATLNELNTRVRDRGAHHDNRLPHHVSVCVAKFDHPAIFEPAVRAGWVTQDSVGSRLPRVPAHHSARFFQWMCEEFRGSTARMVRDGLATFFHPDRISYYATSAIGFRLNPQHVFDYHNYANVEMVEERPRICTSPEPINVLEPLIDLERRIHTRPGLFGAKRSGQ